MALYFKFLYTHSFSSASFTHLNPSNSLWSNYQMHCLHQNSNHCKFFPINFKNMFAKKRIFKFRRIYRVVQIKVYDRICSLHYLIDVNFLSYSFLYLKTQNFCQLIFFLQGKCYKYLNNCKKLLNKRLFNQILKLFKEIEVLYKN